MKFNKFIEIARALAPERESRCFHVTFVVKKRKIVAIGTNKAKTHPRNLTYNYVSDEGTDIRRTVKLHSELSSVLKYGRDDCSDCVFVNVRIDHHGNVKNSRPCRGCQSVLEQVGFKQIYYSDDNGEFNLFN